eukprot:TRINITY_DN22057_c0_g1_i2.p1 TRINITY_DN22057_c0_g1~~TRINITY_DN22057_c0_g1_i2.p1  ORF type:complete len:224 (+),score=48.14 TRINITY_DN22057_c0_g1_i2:66-737(+)
MEEGRIPVKDEEWAELLEATHVDKSSLNRIVMNWLEVEGFRDTAESFAEEAGVHCDLEGVGDRIAIRQLMQSGDVSTAVDKVNAMDPEVLSDDPCLQFELWHQQLVEIIRSGDVDGAITFAQRIAPFAEPEPAEEDEADRPAAPQEHLRMLEQALSLLCFDDPAASPHGDLVGMQHRNKVASRLNAALLQRQGHESEPHLHQLLRLVLRNAIAVVAGQSQREG